MEQTRWYHKSWVIILLLLFLPPLGLLFLWLGHWGKRVKLAVTVTVVALFGVTLAVKLPEKLEQTRAMRAVEEKKTELRELATRMDEEQRKLRAAEDARWRELLGEGGRYYQLLSSRLHETPDPQKRIGDGAKLRLGDFNGRVVLLNGPAGSPGKTGGAGVTGLKPVKEYQPPREGYSFLLVGDTLPGNISFRNAGAREVLILAEITGAYYLATYEVIGDVYERAVRFRIFDTASGELLGWYQTYPQRHHVPNQVGEIYKHKTPDEHGIIYMNTDDPQMRQSGGDSLFLNRLRDALK